LQAGAGAADRGLRVAHRAGVAVERRPEAAALLDLAELVGGSVTRDGVNLLERLLRSHEERELLRADAGQRSAGPRGAGPRTGIHRVDRRRLGGANAARAGPREVLN